MFFVVVAVVYFFPRLTAFWHIFGRTQETENIKFQEIVFTHAAWRKSIDRLTCLLID